MAPRATEPALRVDVANDGLGTIAGKIDGGGFKVLATDLGANLYQLDAVGTTRTSNSSLREIVEVAPSLKFPPGAMSILGAVDRTRIQMKKDFGLVLDGGNSAALSITDPPLFNGIAQEFVNVMDSRTRTDQTS